MRGTHNAESAEVGRVAKIAGAISYGLDLVTPVLSYALGAPSRAPFKESEFNILIFDTDKKKITPGAVEEIRAAQAAQSAKLIAQGPIVRGEQGADLNAAGLDLSIKAYRDASILSNPRSMAKLVGSLKADENMKLLLDVRALSSEQTAQIIQALTQRGIDPSRILAPAPKNYGPITVIKSDGTKNRH
jgi:filamentous hemagglutinin